MRYITFLLTCITSLGFSDINTCFPSNLTSPTPATLMSAGVANEVYVVNSSSPDPHILKIFNRKTIQELEHAESLLQLVREAGIGVPESIIPPTQKGQRKENTVRSFVSAYNDIRPLKAAELDAFYTHMKMNEAVYSKI